MSKKCVLAHQDADKHVSAGGPERDRASCKTLFLGAVVRHRRTAAKCDREVTGLALTVGDEVDPLCVTGYAD